VENTKEIVGYLIEEEWICGKDNLKWVIPDKNVITSEDIAYRELKKLSDRNPDRKQRIVTVYRN